MTEPTSDQILTSAYCLPAFSLDHKKQSKQVWAPTMILIGCQQLLRMVLMQGHILMHLKGDQLDYDKNGHSRLIGHKCLMLF